MTYPVYDYTSLYSFVVFHHANHLISSVPFNNASELGWPQTPVAQLKLDKTLALAEFARLADALLQVQLSGLFGVSIPSLDPVRRKRKETLEAALIAKGEGQAGKEEEAKAGGEEEEGGQEGDKGDDETSKKKGALEEESGEPEEDKASENFLSRFPLAAAAIIRANPDSPLTQSRSLRRRSEAGGEGRQARETKTAKSGKTSTVTEAGASSSPSAVVPASYPVTGSDFWVLQALSAPIVESYRYHFSGHRPTNRLDKAEWFLTHALTELQHHLSFIERYWDPVLRRYLHPHPREERKGDASGQRRRLLVENGEGEERGGEEDEDEDEEEEEEELWRGLWSGPASFTRVILSTAADKLEAHLRALLPSPPPSPRQPTTSVSFMAGVRVRGRAAVSHVEGERRDLFRHTIEQVRSTPELLCRPPS